MLDFLGVMATWTTSRHRRMRNRLLKRRGSVPRRKEYGIGNSRSGIESEGGGGGNTPTKRRKSPKPAATSPIKSRSNKVSSISASNSNSNKPKPAVSMYKPKGVPDRSSKAGGGGYASASMPH
mmetsp:Transcript_17468/g.36855  ORF Transcript_17468/g.36855 Transcript_17468/m.36855 type:complete len:123 (+) Transcript_17468:497-865(+)